MWIRRNLLLWALAVAFAAVAAPVPADENGEAALRAAFKKLHAAKTYSADIASSISLPGQPTLKGTVAAKKPNFLRVELKGPSTVLFVSDGKDYYILQGTRYQKLPLEPAPAEFRGQWEGEIDAFFGGEKGLAGRQITSEGSETVDGVECDLVRVAGGENRSDIVYAVGKADRLIRRAAMIYRRPDGSTITQTNTLTAIRLDKPIEAKQFAFVPPAGAQVLDFEARLVPVGKDAPQFALPSPSGGEVSLRDALLGKKAVVVNFWFYG